MTPPDWRKLKSKTVLQTSIFRLRRDRVVNPRTQNELDTYVLECPDWINIIALTSDKKVVMVKQFRHGVGRVTLEIPGGVVDPGELPVDTAGRELLEETGYKAGEIIPIGVADSQPAYQDNRCHTFLATGAVKVADPDPDDGEDLEVELVELADIPAMIASGKINHGLIIAAFHWLHLWQEEKGG